MCVNQKTSRGTESADSGAARKPQVVIVGAGFGGLAAAKALADAPVAVTVVDRQNYHLFQPLLYQVATAALSPGDIAWPIRRLLRRQPNARVLLGEVTVVDTARKVLHMGKRSLPYDYLVLSTGVRHDYFGRGDWERLPPGSSTSTMPRRSGGASFPLSNRPRWKPMSASGNAS